MYEWQDDNGATMLDRNLGAVLKTIYGFIPDGFPQKQAIGRQLANIVNSLPTQESLQRDIDHKYETVWANLMSRHTFKAIKPSEQFGGGPVGTPRERAAYYYEQHVVPDLSVGRWMHAAVVLDCILSNQDTDWKKAVALLLCDDEDYRKYERHELPAPGGKFQDWKDSRALGIKETGYRIWHKMKSSDRQAAQARHGAQVQSPEMG